MSCAAAARMRAGQGISRNLSGGERQGYDGCWPLNTECAEDTFDGSTAVLSTLQPRLWAKPSLLRAAG